MLNVKSAKRFRFYRILYLLVMRSIVEAQARVPCIIHIDAKYLFFKFRKLDLNNPLANVRFSARIK